MHANSQLKSATRYNPNNRHVRSSVWWLPLLWGLGFAALNPLECQAQPPRLNDLANDTLAIRNNAEKRIAAYLVQSNQSISEWLADQPASPLLMAAEVQHRLDRIRYMVAESRQKELVQATSVQLDKIANAEQLLMHLRQATTAPIQFDSKNSEPTSLLIPEFKQPSEFWQALDQFCRINSLSIGQTEGRFVLSQSDDSSQENTNAYLYTNSKGPVWTGLLQSNSSSSFDQLRIQILWEPKLKVLSAQFPLKELAIEKANGVGWGTINRDAVLNVPIREQTLGTRFRLPVSPHRATGDSSTEPMAPPALIEIPYRLVVLAKTAQSRFDKILELDKPMAPFRSGMAAISVHERSLQDGTLRVQVLTEYDPQRMAQRIQSHDTWSQFCRGHLKNVDGTVLQPARAQQFRQNAYQHMMEFEFELPDNNRQNLLDQQWALEFETPSGMMALEDTITLRQGN